jgi:hypothetical protein
MGRFSRTDFQTPSVADETALSDIWVSKEEDGSYVYVQSTQSYYSLNKSSGAAAVAGSVVAPRAGAPIAGFSAARWTRQASTGSNTFGTQPTWYVDPINGNDNNTGLTAPTALQTLGELARRLDRQLLNQQTDVYILSSTPAIDNFYLECEIGPLGVLTIHGTPTTLHTGSLTAVTNLDQTTQTPSSITDALVGDWTPFVNKRIRLTNGAQAGAMAWIAKRTAATVARTTAWENYNATTPPYAVTPAAHVNAPNGSAYVVEELTAILGSTLFDIKAPDTFDPTFGSIRFMVEGCSFPGDKLAVRNSGGSLMMFAHSDVVAAVTLAGSVVRYLNTSFIATEVQGGTVVVYEGGLNGEFEFLVNANAQCTVREVLSQGGNFRVLGELFVAGSAGLGIFDVAGAVPALMVEPGGLARDNLIWGLNNADVGIRVRAAGAVVYQAKPTLTGTSDTDVGGTPKAYAAIPYVEPANNAMIVAD